MSEQPCPCGSGKYYGQCCGPYHTRRADPPTAEALMRSRYSAYVLSNAKYLYRSWDEQTRPSLQQLRAMPHIQWLGLTIKQTAAGGVNDDNGTVAFVARYLDGANVVEMAETSRFRKRSGKWIYVGGDLPTGPSEKL